MTTPKMLEARRQVGDRGSESSSHLGRSASQWLIQYQPDAIHFQNRRIELLSI
jgi:hypothetical protein